MKVPDNSDDPPGLPFCISPSVWVQITRALTPRTEDFDRTVVDLLTSPFVGYRPAVNPAVVQEVVGRMDHYQDASPKMAVAVLTDTAKVAAIGKAISTDDEAAIEHAVKTAYSAKAKEMQEAVEASQRRLREIETALRRSETETVEAQRQHDRDSADRDRHAQTNQDRWQTEKEVLEGKLGEIEADRDRSTARADDADRRLKTVEIRLEDDDRRKKRNRRLAVAIGLIAIGAGITLALPLAVFHTPWGVGGSIFGGVALALAGIRLVLGRKHGNEFVLWAGLLAAIAAVLVAVVLGSQ